MIRKARKIRGSPELCDLMGGVVGICAGPDLLPAEKTRIRTKQRCPHRLTKA